MSSTSRVSLTFCIVTLFLFFVLTHAARPSPAFVNIDPAKTQHEEVGENQEMEDKCESIGEDECLMRRTLAAHTDYIYTQKHKP